MSLRGSKFTASKPVFGIQGSLTQPSTSNTSFCSNCGVSVVPPRKLQACAQCKCVLYCSKTCQSDHWKSGHKKKCKDLAASAAAAADAPAVLRTNRSTAEAVADGGQCVICLDLDPMGPSTTCTLRKCGHTFHRDCVAGLQEFGLEMNHVCPLCRVKASDLHPQGSAPQQFEVAVRRLFVLVRRAARGHTDFEALADEEEADFAGALAILERCSKSKSTTSDLDVDDVDDGEGALGYPPALALLGLLHHHGYLKPGQTNAGVNSPSGGGAEQWWRSASELGHARSQFNLSVLLKERGEEAGGAGPEASRALLEESVKWTKASAVLGLAEAQNNLGSMYASGVAVGASSSSSGRGGAGGGTREAPGEDDGVVLEKDPVLAVEWLAKAAEQRFAPAMMSLAETVAASTAAMANANADDSEDEDEAGEEEEEVGGEDGSSGGGVGSSGERATGAARDAKSRAQRVLEAEAEMAKWYLRAARGDLDTVIDEFGGDRNAQTKMGQLHQEGRGVPQSDEAAVKWYTRAADQGDPEAQFRLGCMYVEGKGMRAARFEDDAGGESSSRGMVAGGSGGGGKEVKEDVRLAHALAYFLLAGTSGHALAQACALELRPKTVGAEAVDLPSFSPDSDPAAAVSLLTQAFMDHGKGLKQSGGSLPSQEVGSFGAGGGKASAKSGGGKKKGSKGSKRK